MADIEVFDHQQDTPQGDWNNSEVPVSSNEKLHGAELVTAEIEAMPLGEVTASMVDCAKVAIEKNLGRIDLPPELAIMAGVRIDDCGVFTGDSPSVETKVYGIEHQFEVQIVRERVGRVGTFNTNNGITTYVDHVGRYSVAPSSTVLMEALSEAGYKQESGYVYCSNGDMPADASRIKQLVVAGEVARSIEVLSRLEKVLGINKSNDVADLIKRCDDVNTPEGRRVNEETKMRQQQLQRYRLAMQRDMMQREGALPPQAEGTPVDHNDIDQ